ncbi:MAG TPA: DUF2059 domain-containing protein [Desulfuromonadaceae bacterium]|jgi:hypothetical protein
MTVKALLLVVALVLLPVLGWTADSDTNEARVAATTEYLKVVSPQNMIDDIISEILKTAPEEHQADLEKTLRTALEPAFIEDLTLKSMPKHFTTSEIRALTKFYSSKEGASIMKKFGAYLSDIMPAIQIKVAFAMQK